VRTVIAMLEESPLDECVVRYAELLTGPRGRLLLIQAIPNHALLGGAHREASVADAHQYLHGLTRRVAFGCPTSTAVVYGDGANAILEELFVQKADLVVTGIPDGHGFGDRPAGSVAAHVLACSPVPVCIARPAGGCFSACRMLASADVLCPWTARSSPRRPCPRPPNSPCCWAARLSSCESCVCLLLSRRPAPRCGMSRLWTGWKRGVAVPAQRRGAVHAL